MRPIRYRPAALLLTGALLSSLAACGQPSTPAQIQKPDEPAPVTIARGKGDDAAAKDEPKKEEAGDGFHFPDDKGGQMLAKVLPPEDKAPGGNENVASGPKRLPGVPGLEHPSVPLGPNQGQVPRLPAGRMGPPLRPRPLPDALPLSGSRPEPPQELQFPAGDRVRLPGPDVNQPAPLPVLATPAPDRSGSDDPTADLSSAAAQGAAMPARATPAPFAKVSLPDPFENRNAVRFREAPPEKGDPVTAAPKPPGK
ncbi:MAG TPA: hypothetical protein VKA46_28325 [Gemmataceae bacterium]|nr:hypothetical protein [Gemmataceae bacterium]